jgi:hypothetical protein
MSVRAKVLRVALALLAIGCGSTPKTAADASDEKVPDAEVTKDPVDTADGGFRLEVSKTFTERKSKGLKVFYTWGDKTEREAWITETPVSWQVQFQDKPDPEKLAQLRLMYTFDATSTEQTAAQTVADDARKIFLDAVRKALQSAVMAEKNKETTFNQTLGQELQALDAPLSKLKAQQTAQGKAAAAVLLEQLSLTKDEAGVFALSAKGRSLLPDLAQLEQDTQKWTKGEAEGRAKAEALKVTKCGQVDLSKASAPDEVVSAVQACRDELVAKIDAAIVAFEKSADYTKLKAKPEPAKRWQQLKDRTVAIRNAKVANDTLLGVQPADVELLQELSDLKDSYDALVGSGDLGPAPATPPAFAPESIPSFWGTFWTVHRLNVLTITNRAHEAFAAKLTQTTLVVTQQHEGKVLLEQSQQRRYWDFSTGAVYVRGVDNVVLPLFLSYCPASCFRRGEDVTDRFLSSLSIDIGTRAGVLDDKVDTRHADRAALLLGGSFNPLYFLRFSTGMYAFDNAQTDNWNQTWYVGGTINVIHVAEMLGPLGIAPGKVEVK